MKRRLNIAAALVHDPDVLIFDEPTVGVDPQSRNAIFDNLETLQATAARRCSTRRTTWKRPSGCATASSIMDHGRVVASDTLAGCSRGVAGGGDGRGDLEDGFPVADRSSRLKP